MTTKNDDITKLERIRAELVTKSEELAEVQNSVLPLAEASLQLRGWIDREAEAFDGPPVSYFARPDFHGPLNLVFLADGSENPALEQRGFTRSAGDNLGSLLCALMPDAVESLLVKRLEVAIAEAPLTLTAAERTARIVALNGEIHGFEIKEERILRAIEDRGAEVARRPNSRPEVVLAVDLALVQQAA